MATQKEKQALMDKYRNSTLSVSEFARMNNIGISTFYSWRNKLKNKTITTKKAAVITKVKGSIKPTTLPLTPSSSVKTTELRVKLYNQLKLEYEELEAQLVVIRHRMQMVGEDWNTP